MLPVAVLDFLPLFFPVFCSMLAEGLLAGNSRVDMLGKIKEQMKEQTEEWSEELKKRNKQQNERTDEQIKNGQTNEETK